MQRLWRLTGIDNANGRECSLDVRASSPEMAAAMGQRVGMHVVHVVDLDAEAQRAYPSAAHTNTNAARTSPSPAVVIVERKSVGLAFLLTLLFGPLGMLYTTVLGALVMLIVSSALACATGGLSLLLTWPICIVWGCLAAGGSKYREI